MDVYEGLAAAGNRLRGAAFTIGNFDGVHLGHRQLLARTKTLALTMGVPAVALTFWPHPASVLAPQRAPALICSRERKLERLQNLGMNAVVVEPFTREFASHAPEAFARNLLDAAGVGAVIVGYDFTYGRGRAGNVDTLRRECDARGVTLEVVPQVTVEGLVVSSSRVREQVKLGRMEAARALLGRPFELQGEVVRGAGRGRGLGVPTANMDPDTDLLPAIGVYAGWVTLPGGERVMSACNVGQNPTFLPESTHGPASHPVSVEAHLLDRDINLYGQRIRLEFVARLRDELRFDSVDALITQMRLDIEQTRQRLSAES